MVPYQSTPFDQTYKGLSDIVDDCHRLRYQDSRGNQRMDSNRPTSRLGILFYKYLAYFIKYFTRTRHSYLLKIKNRDILVKGKIRYSGAKLRLNIGDFVQYYIFMDGAYEPEWLDFIAPLSENKVFFDVGANVGNYALSLHTRAKMIYAFEPSEGNMAYLRENIASNKIENIETVRKAVSSEDGKRVKIYFSPDAGGSNSLYDKFDGRHEIVETVTLDTFCRTRNIEQVDIIKMDVEGAEFDALIGAEKTLKRFHPLLLVEFCSTNAEAAGYRLKEQYLFIMNLGYSAYLLYKGKLKATGPDTLDIPGYYQDNLIFIPDNILSGLRDDIFSIEG